MKEPSETVSESVEYLGQGFLLAYYLPALVFVLVHLYVLAPALTGLQNTSDAATQKCTPSPMNGESNVLTWNNVLKPSSLVDSLLSLLWSLIVGIALFVLNSILIRSFEGKPRWLKEVLLSRLTKRNKIECEKLYGRLISLRTKLLEYQIELNKPESQKSSQESQDLLKGKLSSIKEEIKIEHEKLGSQQTLPHGVERVCATAFGNNYAIAEEYSYERYGADSVLFWPHLRALMQEKAVSHSLKITQQKTVLDLSINFAFLSGLLTVEAILILMFSDEKLQLLLLAGVAFILSIGFYHASVTAIKGLGSLIKVSFDQHRGLVLQAFNLRKPGNLSEEQTVWVKLAAFIQRGEAFYFPEEYRDSTSEGNVIEEKKKDE